MEIVSNVLAERYASKSLKDIWSPTGRIRLERDFWIAVMKAQKELGLDIPQEAIDAYEAKKDQVDLEAIRLREEKTRHDVKARIEAFCELAGHEHIHKGMTSRDLTENVEQLQIFKSLQIIQKKAYATLYKISKLAKSHESLVITARTHNVAAQPSTLGKRFAMFGQELLIAIKNLNQTLANYPGRGLKGAVGTQVDQLTLFNGDAEKVSSLEKKILQHLNIPQVLENVGQVYPRSLDFEVISSLVQLAAGPSSMARTLRLMAGNETASEGFSKGQVGSSAMPHKMNARSCERVNGFKIILNGYLSMAAELSGSQWNEGDVSCSVVRRVMMSDAFFAIDGLFETFLTVLNQMETFPAVIAKENQHYFPFLATTTILMEAVKAGAGRESAHEAIKEHAVGTVLDLRKGKIERNDLIDRLARDERLGLSREQLNQIISNAEELTGNAKQQVYSFTQQVESLLEKLPEAKTYEPGSIL